MDHSESRVESPWLIRIALTLLVSIPCLWQPHVTGTDFPSHLYNAWFGQRLEANPVAGIQRVTTFTNVLADHLLGWTTNAAGVVVAEPLIPLIAVILFFWGAFWWLQEATGRAPWSMAPVLAMLSYGAIFHLGFLNYYISAALCLWILALAWKPNTLRVGVAALLALLALTAHPLPLLWTAIALLYVSLVHYTPRDLRAWVLGAALIALVALHGYLSSQFPSRPVWNVESPSEIALGMMGTGQLWVFGPKYLTISAGLAVLAGVGLWHRIEIADAKRGYMMDDAAFHLWILNAAALVAVPASVQLPQYEHVLAFLPERLSLFAAILLCMVLAKCMQGLRTLPLSLAAAGLFFSFLYVDSSAYNRVEAEVDALVRTLPAGEMRVVGPIYDEGAKIPALLHVIDRQCVGRCLSYADYEPATHQFRIQATGDNPLVAWRMSDVQNMESGDYTVKPTEEPIYSICQCEVERSNLCLRRVAAGAKTCSTTLSITPRWWRAEVQRDATGLE